MQKINLLPWRQQQVKHYRKRFWLKCILLALLLTALLGSLRFSFLAQLDEQQARNIKLNKEIAKQNQAIKIFATKDSHYQSLQKRLDLIYQLQTQRNNSTLVLNILPSVIPPEVVLDKLSMVDEVINIEGRGRNNQDLTKMLSWLERNQQIQNIKMHSIVNSDKNQESAFKVSFTLQNFTKPNLIEN